MAGHLNRHVQQTETCTDTHHDQHVTDATAHYGEREDPCKITYSRMAFIERGLGNERPHANEHTKARLAGEDEQVRSRLAMARASQRTSCVDAVAEELEEVGIRTLGARTRAVQL